MAEKRRDNKGRVLRDGESQRKDGKYDYRYTDSRGGRHSVYSWRLVETDKMPPGKKFTPPLRELEKEIQRDIDSGLDLWLVNNATVDQYFKKLTKLKQGLALNTQRYYQILYNANLKNQFGHRKISSITHSEIVAHYLYILREKQNTLVYLKMTNTVLNQLFELAIKDGAVRKNPLTGAVAEVSQAVVKKMQKKMALTIPEQKAFLNQARAIPRYRYLEPLFVTMLGTGMRIGETAALTWDDVDFDENIIHVNKNMQHCDRSYYITTPKTKAGTRMIPMVSEVREVLLREKERQTNDGFNELTVDGVTGFVFATKLGKPVSSTRLGKAIAQIIKSHNANNPEVPLPYFTPHILRHTFCTRLCENESNVKLIQEIMGHSDIAVTMGVYTDITKDKKLESFKKYDGKLVF